MSPMRFYLEGYSWLTNEYGLAVDNVVAFEVVLPNGRVISASAGTNSDLFFALKVRMMNRHDQSTTDRSGLLGRLQ